MSKRPYIIIVFGVHPTEEARTEMPKWLDTESNVKITEEYSFSLKITDKQMHSASVIIDLLSKKVVKNRYPEHYSDDVILKHYYDKYGDEIKRYIINFMLRNETKLTNTGNRDLPSTLSAPIDEPLVLDTSPSSLILGAE